MKQVLLTMGVVAGMSLPVFAQESDSVSTATVYACAEISSDADRLACYDSAVGRLKTAEETGDLVTVSRKEVEEVKRESFGFHLPSLPKFAFGDDSKSDVDEVTLPVDRLAKAPMGGFVIYLENGQVWEQTDDKRVPYSRKVGVDNATIKSAAFGSYMMKLDSGPLFRVRRVQ